MAHNFALQPLLELMQERTDEASRRLGQLIAAEQNSRQQLSMLEEYRNEYVERLRQTTQAGTTRQIIANYQEFLRRIEEAIEQQTKQVRQSESNTLRGQQHWRTQNTRLKAIDTLAIRHEEKLRKHEDKKAQKLLDEFTTRKFSTPKEDS